MRTENTPALTMLIVALVCVLSFMAETTTQETALVILGGLLFVWGRGFILMYNERAFMFADATLTFLTAEGAAGFIFSSGISAESVLVAAFVFLLGCAFALLFLWGSGESSILGIDSSEEESVDLRVALAGIPPNTRIQLLIAYPVGGMIEHLVWRL